MLGGDIMPQSFMQMLVGSVGIFMGAVINANIFGELSVILGSIGTPEKEFQALLSAINTAMINLKLPEEVQQNVRVSIIRNSQSKQS